MKRPFVALDTSSIIASEAGGSRNQSMQFKLELTPQNSSPMVYLTILNKCTVAKIKNKIKKTLEADVLPIQVLFVFHLIFSSPLSNKINPINS